MEENKFRITVLDILLILFLVLAILMALLNAGVIEIEPVATDNITFVLKTLTPPVKSAKATNKETNQAVGTVLDVLPTALQVEIADTNGAFHVYNSTSENCYYVTISGQGQSNSYGYYLSDGTVVAPGTELILSVRNEQVAGIVVDVH